MSACYNKIMKQHLTLLCSLSIISINGMNIYSMIDGVNINLNDYIEVQNYNEAQLQVVDDKTALNQILTVDITTINMNHEFDVLIFERPSENEESQDYLCYLDLVKAKNWSKECNFGPLTQQLLRQQHYDVGVKSLNDSNNIDRHIIIDNSPFPVKGGAFPQASITSQSSRSQSQNASSAYFCCLAQQSFHIYTAR
ncbi:hypothetical protein FGO68_gene2043 [Halteria grandinella]|uniref:Uncharacterized protein n=1 Tax=Halteria grandinella TaxID=5974 RepID=A0A8J8NJC0_HALGN|nr:hypothetical protein FGO68_gene2043 [Halteria grandinella]